MFTSRGLPRQIYICKARITSTSKEIFGWLLILSMMAGLNMKRLSLMCSHDNHLLRGTFVEFRRILPILCKQGLGLLSVKGNLAYWS
jgi:hypothetical protein